MATLLSPPPEIPWELADVSWDLYLHMADEFHKSGARVIYSNGRMEIVTVSFRHELIRTAAAKLLGVYSLEKDVPILAGGSVAIRSENDRCALEPDECFYIITPRPPAIDQPIDISKVAAPDLAIEVEISRSSIPKLPMYQSLGIAEVWRWSGDRFVVLQRQADDNYAPRDSSRLLPGLSIEMLSSFIRMSLQSNDHEAAKGWRDHLRSQ